MTTADEPGTGTVGGLLRHHAAHQPDAPCLLFEGDVQEVVSFTYAEVYERASRAAGILLGCGVRKGDRYHIHLPNSIAFMDAWLGGALIGAIAVPTNPQASADDVAYILSHSGAVLSVTETFLLERMDQARWISSSNAQILVTGHESDASVPTDHVDWDASFRAQALPESLPTVSPEDHALVLYTSGTTGWPKGVQVTHANLSFVGEVVSQWLRMRPEDRWLLSLPMFHGNSMYYGAMSALHTGASVALMRGFSAARWREQARRFGATLSSLFAAHLRMLMSIPPSDEDRAHSLRQVVFAQNLTPQHLTTLERRLGVGLLQLYGMTETIAPPVVNPLYGRRQNMSMGRPAPWAKVRIVDAEGAAVPDGDPGELLVHGDAGCTLMAGYYDNPLATSEALQGDWLHTGDYVRQGPDGFLYFLGRSTDLLKPTEETISAVEIERVVAENWAVRECAVVGVQDEANAEKIVLYAALYAEAGITPAELSDWCQEHLAPSKVPHEIKILDKLPRTAVGKVDKRTLSSLDAGR